MYFQLEWVVHVYEACLLDSLRKDVSTVIVMFWNLRLNQESVTHCHHYFMRKKPGTRVYTCLHPSMDRVYRLCIHHSPSTYLFTPPHTCKPTPQKTNLPPMNSDHVICTYGW